MTLFLVDAEQKTSVSIDEKRRITGEEIELFEYFSENFD